MNLLIVDSHPIQYRAPLIVELKKQLEPYGVNIKVIYFSDFSLQGARDIEFGQPVTWDEPLLEGYDCSFLKSKDTRAPRRFWDLNARAFRKSLGSFKPNAALFFNLNFLASYQILAYLRVRGIPCHIRVETSDVAILRSGLKKVARSFWYRFWYTLFEKAIAISSHNSDHLRTHGFQNKNIHLALYSVPNRFEAISTTKKQEFRTEVRNTMNLGHAFTFLFCGKLIKKKGVDLLFEALMQLPAKLDRPIALIVLGSGEEEAALKAMSPNRPDISVHFLGFKNQLELPPYYLAADGCILLSRQMGETWGLVVNEAVQAGLPCVISKYVGSSRDLGQWEGIEMVDPTNILSVVSAMVKCTSFKRDFDRYSPVLNSISIKRTAEVIGQVLLKG